MSSLSLVQAAAEGFFPLLFWWLLSSHKCPVNPHYWFVISCMFDSQKKEVSPNTLEGFQRTSSLCQTQSCSSEWSPKFQWHWNKDFSCDARWTWREVSVATFYKCCLWIMEEIYRKGPDWELMLCSFRKDTIIVRGIGLCAISLSLKFNLYSYFCHVSSRIPPHICISVVCHVNKPRHCCLIGGIHSISLELKQSVLPRSL